MALRKLLKLYELQLRYLAAMMRSPGHARFFWSELFHSATVSDRSLAAATDYGLPTISPEEALRGITGAPFSLVDFQEEYGGVSYTEVRVLCASIQLLKPKRLFEFGTFNGATTRQLVINAPDDAVITTIDLPPDHPLRRDQQIVDVKPQKVGSTYRGTPQQTQVRQLYGNTLEYDFSPYYRSADWIFVDASHAYEAVIADSTSALRMIRPGGLIFWHDVSTKFAGNCRALGQVATRVAVHHLAGTSLALHRAPQAREAERKEA